MAELVNQSPIALSDDMANLYTSELASSAVELPHHRFGYRFENIDKPIFVIDPATAPKVEYGGSEYKGAEFHFHAPTSEHTLNGKRFAAESHIVLASSDTSSLVLATMYKLTRKHCSAKFIRNVLARKPVRIPDIEEYFAYSGSLTQGQTDETIDWVVNRRVEYITLEDWEALELISQPPREIQKRFGRVVALQH